MPIDLLNECICLNVNIFDCDVYMPRCNWCVLLSESIHVLMLLLCWIYSHPLLDCTLVWYKYIGRRTLVVGSLGGRQWAFLVLFFRCLESFILFWVKLEFFNTRDWGLFSIIILCFGIQYLNSHYFIKIIVTSFFGDQGYLISFWLTNLFHDFEKII